MVVKIEADWLTRPETRAVFAAFEAAQIEARAVGGAVRNALIGKPASDVDLSTPALPDVTMAAARRAGLSVVPTGLQHGTVTIVSGGIPFEVTTLRRDVETDGRHAVVAFTDDWSADASRRDFTINALYCDADGTLHDPLGGYDDLLARRVRFIGDADARIQEDYLRILRFFRFTAEYGVGTPDAIGLRACSMRRDGLWQLSAERIRTELLKLLVASRAVAVVDVMGVEGYWPALLGAVPRPLRFARMVSQDETARTTPDARLRLAALGVATREDASRIATRLRLSSRDAALIDACARLAPALEPMLNQHDLRVLLYREGRSVLEGAARYMAALGDPAAGGLPVALVGLGVPVFPLRGQDLIDAGAAAGPGIGEALRRLESVWIASGFLATKADLLAYFD